MDYERREKDVVIRAISACEMGHFANGIDSGCFYTEQMLKINRVFCLSLANNAYLCRNNPLMRHGACIEG